MAQWPPFLLTHWAYCNCSCCTICIFQHILSLFSLKDCYLPPLFLPSSWPLFLDCDWSWATFSDAVICLHFFFIRNHGLGSAVCQVLLPFLAACLLFFFLPILSFLLVFSLEVPDNTGIPVQWCGSSNTQLEWDPSPLSLGFNAHFIMLLSLALCRYINIERDFACPRSVQSKQMYKTEETQKEIRNWRGSLYCRKYSFTFLRYFHLIPSFQYLKLSLESMSGDPEL